MKKLKWKKVFKTLTCSLLTAAVIVLDIPVSMVMPQEYNEVYAEEVKSAYPEVNPQNTSNLYYYNQLAQYQNGTEMQRYYNALVLACMKFYNSSEEAKTGYFSDGTKYYYLPDVLTAKDYNLTVDERQLAETCVNHDNPLFYFLSNGVTSIVGEDKSERTPATIEDNGEIRIICEDTDNELQKEAVSYENGERRAEIKELIEEKLHYYYDLTEDMTTLYEKERLLFNEVCNNSDYSYDDLRAIYAHNITGNLENRDIVCEGYAKVSQLLLNYCGVENIVIDGEAEGVAHAWNGVKLDDGKWYLSDVTWSDIGHIEYEYGFGASGTSTIYGENQQCNEIYVNQPAELFNRQHISYDVFELPEFSNETTYYSGYNDIYITLEKQESMTKAEIEEAIYNEIVKQLTVGDTTIEICFDDRYYMPDITNMLSTVIGKATDTIYNSTGRKYQGGFNFVAFSLGYKYDENGDFIKDGNGEKIITMKMYLPFSLIEKKNNYEIASYHIYGGGIGICDVTEEKSSTLKMPSYIDDKVVTCWDTAHKQWSTDIKNLIVSDYIVYIGDFSFMNCMLKYVQFNEGLFQIGYMTFFNCPDLKSVYIPASVKFISPYALGYIGEEGDETTLKKVEGFTIYGDSGSAAETYAKENGFIFKPASEYVPDIDTDDTGDNTDTDNETGGNDTDKDNETGDNDTGKDNETGDNDNTDIPEKVSKGDIDGDGKVNIVDAMRIFHYVSGRNKNMDISMADINGDGKVNIIDAMRVFHYVSGRNKEL